jgi:hypothetical protein
MFVSRRIEVFRTLVFKQNWLVYAQYAALASTDWVGRARIVLSDVIRTKYAIPRMAVACVAPVHIVQQLVARAPVTASCVLLDSIPVVVDQHLAQLVLLVAISPAQAKPYAGTVPPASILQQLVARAPVTASCVLLDSILVVVDRSLAQLVLLVVISLARARAYAGTVFPANIACRLVGKTPVTASCVRLDSIQTSLVLQSVLLVSRASFPPQGHLIARSVPWAVIAVQVLARVWSTTANVHTVPRPWLMVHPLPCALLITPSTAQPATLATT